MQLSAVSQDDLQAIGILHVSAFAQNDSTRLLFPARLRNADITAKQRGTLYGHNMSREMDRLGNPYLAQKVTSEEDEIVGYAMWLAPVYEGKDSSKPAAAGTDTSSKERSLFEAERDGDAAARRNNLVKIAREKQVPGPHWYLLRLCTKPGYERQGIGSRLVQAGLEHIDNVDPSLLVVLCASSTGQGLYEKFGFESFAEVNMTEPQNKYGNAVPTHYSWQLMFRQPKE